MRIAVAVTLFVVLISFTTASAEFYSYIDESGTEHIVDDISRIPKKFRKKKRVVDNEPSGDPSPKATRVRIYGNQVLVPATLHSNGRDVRATFLLDTGASTTTISESLAEKLGIDVASGRPILGQVAGGGLLLVMRVTLDQMVIGPNCRFGVDVDVMRHQGPQVQFDGLLGMNFLRNYGYSLDIPNRLIRWE